MINKSTVVKLLFITVLFSLILAMAFGCGEETSTVVGAVTPDATGTTDGLKYTEYTDGSVAVTEYTGNDTKIVVAATAGGKAVTSIGTVFKGTSIQAISLPDTITNLTEGAFQDCTDLSSITARGVVRIGASALENTQWLANQASDELIYFNTVFIGVKYVEKTAADFAEVVFPATTSSAQEGVLSNLSATTSFTIPSTMYLSGREFDGMSNVSSFVVTAGAGAINYWSNGTAGELLNADKSTLYKYPEGNEASTYTIPASVKEIEPYACQNANFSTVTMSCSADKLGDYAFSNSANLFKITYTGANCGFKECGSYIFNGCKALTSFTTPGILVKLGNYALCNSGITNIAFETTSTFVEIGKDAFKGLGNFMGMDDSGNLTLPDSIKVIGSGAFVGTNITNVTLGAGTKRLGALAFYNTPITNVTLNEGLQTIGDEAFYMTNITSITLPLSLLEIGSAAFASSKIANVYYVADGETNTSGAKLEKIGASAFRNTPLASFVIPFSTTSIGAYAFADTQSISTVTVNRSRASEITASGMYVFDNSTALIKVPFDSLDSYREGYGWQDFADKIDIFTMGEDTYTYVFNTCGGGGKESVTNPTLNKADTEHVHVAKNETPLALLDVDTSAMQLSNQIYVLEGWYKDAAYTEKVSFTDGGAAVLTNADFTEVEVSQTYSFYYVNLYAKWITYNISFDTHGGSSVQTINTCNPSVLLANVQTTLEGSTFDGWYYDAETTVGVEVIDGALNIVSDKYTESTMTYKYSHFVQYTYYTYNITIHTKWRQNNENN